MPADELTGGEMKPANQSATTKQKVATSQVTAAQPQAADQSQSRQIEELKSRINAATETSALVTLYLENTALIEGNAEVKRLITSRKKALTALNS